MILAILLMAAAVVLIPFGLPGVWIIAGILMVGLLLGELVVWVPLVAVVVAAVAEGAEFFIVRSMNVRYGGSPRAFWAAIGGGVVGMMVGAPVLIVGSLVGGFIGSFAGAALVSYYELRDTGAAGRIAWGIVLARTAAVVVKVAAGLALLVLGGFMWGR